jgi:hypothetical protein
VGIGRFSADRFEPRETREEKNFDFSGLEFVRAFRAFRGLKEDFKSMENKDLFEGA